MASVNFEGLIPSNSFGTVPNGYAGLLWNNAGLLGKKYIDNNFPAGTDGYHSVIGQKTVAYAADNGGVVDTGIGTATKGGTFTLKSGTFAAAWNIGETVTFHAFKDGHEFTKSVVLDRTAVEITFGNHFKHVSAVQITATGGEDADPLDEGNGRHVAIDDLRIVLDVAREPAHTAHEFSAQQLAEQAINAWHSHWSDWPLA